jgi:cell division septation protein DedD
VASQVQDDGFHEIQLNGKQLVFLFMAATVVSVVIFLCGVLVGRGVRAERGGDVASNTSPEAIATTPQQPAAAAAPAPAGSDPTAAAPPPAATDDLTYFNRLEKQKASEEKLKAAPAQAPAAPPRAAASTAEPAAKPPAAAPPPAAATTPPAAAATPSATAAPPPATTATPRPAPATTPAAAAADAGQSGSGFAVQVAALNVRSDAEAIAKRLSSKGYAAYVLPPASGTPSVYRVRVGKFPTRREADSMAARLKREEQFNPWVTR